MQPQHGVPTPELPILVFQTPPSVNADEATSPTIMPPADLLDEDSAEFERLLLDWGEQERLRRDELKAPPPETQPLTTSLHTAVDLMLLSALVGLILSGFLI